MHWNTPMLQCHESIWYSGWNQGKARKKLIFLGEFRGYTMEMDTMRGCVTLFQGRHERLLTPGRKLMVDKKNDKSLYNMVNQWAYTWWTNELTTWWTNELTGLLKGVGCTTPKAAASRWVSLMKAGTLEHSWWLTGSSTGHSLPSAAPREKGTLLTSWVNEDSMYCFRGDYYTMGCYNSYKNQNWNCVWNHCHQGRKRSIVWLISLNLTTAFWDGSDYYRHT